MINRLSGLVLGPAVALALAGCQETTQTAQRPRVDAPGVPVSVQSISGAPDDVTTSFAGLLGEAAAERKMEIVPGDKPARFRVKGYLTAQPTEDGQTALAFVWDVYDSTRQRAQRVQGESIGKRSAGSDPWTGIDRTVVAKAASESMDAIAGFLVTMPEAETTTDKAGKAGADGAKARTATATGGDRKRL
ncbi:hypothetical protein [Bosea sp. (in: a-proteobacteria)]|uniref:hypothetical protein n=1 Tax=Bosea sp. (in: a-proteobacteria) TaxID=1871050 RepID=UPI003B3A31FF